MTDKVREAFGAWLKNFRANIGHPSMFEVYQAGRLNGRESMREEAMAAVEREHMLDNTGEDSDPMPDMTDLAAERVFKLLKNSPGFVNVTATVFDQEDTP